MHSHLPCQDPRVLERWNNMQYLYLSIHSWWAINIHSTKIMARHQLKLPKYWQKICELHQMTDTDITFPQFPNCGLPTLHEAPKFKKLCIYWRIFWSPFFCFRRYMKCHKCVKFTSRCCYLNGDTCFEVRITPLRSHCNLSYVSAIHLDDSIRLTYGDWMVDTIWYLSSATLTSKGGTFLYCHSIASNQEKNNYPAKVSPNTLDACQNMKKNTSGYFNFQETSHVSFVKQ